MPIGFVSLILRILRFRRTPGFQRRSPELGRYQLRKQLAEFLKRNGDDQTFEQFARKIGLSDSMLQRIETMERQDRHASAHRESIAVSPFGYFPH
jgi:hypothetical protein